MALADYKTCDVCGEKAFYDANLNYEQGSDGYGIAYKVAGEKQFANEELIAKYGMKLDRVGDWAVLCNECSKTHRTVIVKTKD